MNVVDSSGWLDYFADGPNAEFFAETIHDLGRLIVPTVSIYEVFKRILQQTTRRDALTAIAQMQQAQVIDLDTPIALLAAHLSIRHRLPMADGIILATARTHGATLWTQDGDFEGVDGVRYRARQPR